LKGIPKTLEGTTDGGLRQVQTLGCSADTSLIDENIQDKEEV
jgi:hypothetical protein